MKDTIPVSIQSIHFLTLATVVSSSCLLVPRSAPTPEACSMPSKLMDAAAKVDFFDTLSISPSHSPMDLHISILI